MTVNVLDIDGMEWERVPDTWAGKVGSGEPGVRYKVFSTGSKTVPTGQIIEYQPGHVEDRHSHDEGEIYYMLEGELNVGGETLAPGMLVYIAGRTEYGPSRTDGGCRFLRLGLVGST